MSDYSELEDPELASKHLASHLMDGTVVLFLGSGVTKEFGLLSWLELVNALRANVGLVSLATGNAEELQLAADEVLDKVGNEGQLINLIQEELYRNLIKLNTSEVFAHPLLLAIAALLMGSKRGHIIRVVTLNYDNLLQWFLSIYGFSVRTIYSLPELEGMEDVRIYHPHGFIPIPSSTLHASDFVILGLDSANRRIGTPGDPWLEMIRHTLYSGLGLFIGMSPNTLSDRALGPLLATCGQKCKPYRPLGIWTLLDDISAAKRAEFQRNNVVPIKFSEPIKIAEFLLEICKEAGQRLLK